MEQFPNSCYNKEYMKMAMLKQEEMFREQVYELHRLYQVQKMLMNSISRNNQNQDRLSMSKVDNDTSNLVNSQDYQQLPRQKLDLEQPAAEEHLAKLDGNGGLEMKDECEIELTLGPSSFYPTRKTKTPLSSSSDSGLSLSSSSGSSSVKGRKNYSNGMRRINDKFTKDKQAVHNWGLVEVQNLRPSFLNDRRNVVTNDNNEQLRQDIRLQHPPWLFQALSMNIT